MSAGMSMNMGAKGLEWLETLGQMSLSASVMILAVIILRLRFRHDTPRRVFCLLWDIVLIRLLLPVDIASPYSIRALLSLKNAALSPVTAFYAVSSPQTVITTADYMRGAQNSILTAGAAFSPLDFQKLLDFLPFIWGAGAAVCAARLLWRHWQSESVYAMSLPVENDFIRRWQEKHPLRRFVQIRRSDRVSAPLTYGIARPVVLLPSRMDLSNHGELSCVLEHEYTHIRRFDTLRKCLLALGLCLHWFNPFVWTMDILANRDIEIACDESVVRSGADRKGYALALLRMEEERGGHALSGSHFSHFSGHALEERIEAIMKHKKGSLAALLAVLVVMSITTTVFATNAPEDENGGGGATAAPSNVNMANISAEWQEVTVLSRADGDETYFSVDDGKTWMTEEQYRAQYGPWGEGGDWEVTWWTYDEYKAWLEQEKADLQDMIGERSWTGGKGWFVWDQAMVDETIALYEKILGEIQNGALYSKSIVNHDGTELDNTELGLVISRKSDFVTTPDDYQDRENNALYYIGVDSVDSDESQFVTGVFTADSDGMIISRMVDYTQEAHVSGVDTSELLKSYQAFGVTGNEQDGLYYNGQPVRRLVDGYKVDDYGYAIRFVYTSENGTIDVHTLRESVPLSGGGVDPAGPLKAVVQAGDTGFDPDIFDCILPENTVPQVTTAEGNASAGEHGRTFEEIFAVYEPWGLRFDPDAENESILTYNGQAVKQFADLQPDGGAFSYGNPYADNGLNVYAEYSQKGELVGLVVR